MTFDHHQSAHCESGVTSGLLQNAGLPVSEAMAFGIGSGIFFAHLPFVKVMELPLTSYRSMPGSIFKKTCHRLGVPFVAEKFRDPILGQRALDSHVEAGHVVGLRSNIYWLPYIPQKFRFQFNAHNLIVYGRQDNGDYLVSDPVMDEASTCSPRDLNRGRFAKGALAPKGLIYYLQSDLHSIDEPRLREAVRLGIAESVSRNLRTFKYFGVPGIQYLARRMRIWPRKFKDIDMLKLNLANVVRMQEEIGTGGAGFRFLYAAFLQEAGERLDLPVLSKSAVDFTEAGNIWRDFALEAARFCKGRLIGSYQQMPDLLMEVAEKERQIFLDLRRNYLSTSH